MQRIYDVAREAKNRDKHTLASIKCHQVEEKTKKVQVSF